MFTYILYSTLCPWFCTFELALLDPEPVGSRTYLAKSGSDDSLRNLNDKKVLEILTQKLNKNYNFCSQNNLFSLPSPKGTQIGKFFRTSKYRVGSGSWCLGNCYPDPAIKEINFREMNSTGSKTKKKSHWTVVCMKTKETTEQPLLQPSS